MSETMSNEKGNFERFRVLHKPRKYRDFNVEIELVEGATKEQIPEYKTSGSAACDLKSSIEAVIKPNEAAKINTGIKIKFPRGYVGMITSRSGLALNDMVVELNSPGYIDSDYRGEVCLILVNHGKSDFIIKKGDRLAQLSFIPVKQAKFKLVDKLSEDRFKNEREDGGFGHTGK